MVVGRALRATGCASCRLSLIRSFASLAGPSIRIQHGPARIHNSGTPSRFRYSSQFARDSRDLDEARADDRVIETEGRELEEDLEEDLARELDKALETDLEEESEAQDAKEVPAIPWYLQVESPQRAPQPLSERQKIPELPTTPPPILEPLLQQVSIDLGMDDLKLLDLRKLDPPPALGANLLMIIGTARSERHLHVSADRLCRWLRSTYKLRPDADGLLGRNELKLKLKRKAKRAKLLGSATDENADDGVRTRWVCVDLGVVEADAVAVEAPQRQDFIGFGRRADDVRIVVQLLTEEKREEIELERLWEGILRRGGQQEVESPVEDQESHISTPDPSHSPSLGAQTSTLGQRRAMHTSARRPMMQETNSSPVFGMPLGPPPRNSSEVFDIQEAVLSEIDSGNFDKAKSDLIMYSHNVPALKGDGWRNTLLTMLRIHIEKVPEAQAIEELAIPTARSEPTPFMASFHSAMTFCPTQFGAESEIRLHSFARDIGHPAYTLYETRGFLNKLQGYGVPISKESYMVLIRSILLPRKSVGPKRQASSHAADAVLDILRVMQDQGLSILDEEMLVELQELTEPPEGHVYRQYHQGQTPYTYDLESQMPALVQRRLHLLMMKLDLPPFNDESRIRLLNLHARNHCWQEFWDVFRMAPRACVPQSPAVYAYMFACVANTGSQKGCMSVLRNWVPGMEREDPPVRLEGEVSEAVKACLLVADPTLDGSEEDNSELKGEWLSMWRRCQ